MTARDQLQAQAKRLERIAAYLYDHCSLVGDNEYPRGDTGSALAAHTAADACQDSAETLRGIAQTYAGRIP